MTSRNACSIRQIILMVDNRHRSVHCRICRPSKMGATDDTTSCMAPGRLQMREAFMVHRSELGAHLLDREQRCVLHVRAQLGRRDGFALQPALHGIRCCTLGGRRPMLIPLSRLQVAKSSAC